MAGGDDTYAWQTQLLANSNFEHQLFAWKNQDRLDYGCTQVGNMNSRKSMDEILVETLLEYKENTLLKL